MTFAKFVLIVTCILIVNVQAFAQDKLKACYEDWPPYMYQTNNGEHKGPVITVIQKIAANLNIELELTPLPYARCLRNVAIKQQDLILGFSGTEEGILNSTNPIVFWNLVAMVREDSVFQEFKTMSQFSGQTILSESTFSYPEPIMGWLKSNKSKSYRFQYGEATLESNLQPFEILLNKKADVFFEDEGWLRTQIKSHKHPVKILFPAVVTDPNFLGFSKGLEKQADAFSKQLTLLIDNQFIQHTFMEEAGFNWNQAYEDSMTN